jgi:hypothetical protein
MYAMMDADFFGACMFFIVCVIVLNFWLINLFVAVIGKFKIVLKTCIELT